MEWGFSRRATVVMPAVRSPRGATWVLWRRETDSSTR
jgi:hypothetical protein